MRASCSTSCIPHRDPAHVESLLPSVDTDSFELFLFSHWDKADLPHLFHGYPFFSVHGTKNLSLVLEEDVEKGIALLKEDITVAYEVEASIVVLHAYNSLNATPNLHRVVEALSRTEAFAHEHSMSLSLELIPHVTLSLPDIATFFSHYNALFTIDIEYASKYNCLHELLSHASRVNNVHVRDYDGQWILDGKRRYLKPGDGNLDFDSIFSAFTRAGYENTYTLEAPHASVEEINASMEWLRAALKSHTSP